MIRKLMLFLTLVSLSAPSLSAEVNVYSGRKEALIKPLLDRFTEQTGIETRLVTAKADKLLVRLQNEGRNTPADLFITVDAGRLHRAKKAGVLQPVESEALKRSVPAHLRDRPALEGADLHSRLRQHLQPVAGGFPDHRQWRGSHGGMGAGPGAQHGASPTRRGP